MKRSKSCKYGFKCKWLAVLITAFFLINCNTAGAVTGKGDGSSGAGTSGAGSSGVGSSGSNTMVPATRTDYESLWKEVDQHFKKGLPKSALKAVTQIYKKAKEQDNAAQLIKALIHKMRFIQDVEEETFVKIQSELNKELKNSSFPITPVLHSIMAEQYWNFYRDNRYRILKRSQTSSDFKQEDMRTWDAKLIIAAVTHHYSKSLEQKAKAKQVKIDIFDAILHKGSSGRLFRPTLYDFLAHRAIDFYKDSEAGLTKPRDAFTLNDDRYFSNTQSFAKLKIEAKEKLSFDFFAITYLQELVRFHLQDKNPDALVDVELKRLAFLYQKSVISNKDIIYEKMLLQLKDKYGKQPITAEIVFELAKLYRRLGNKYKPHVSDDYKWHIKKAYDLCQQTIHRYPGTIGAHNCRSLAGQIKGKKLNLTLEKANPSLKPFRALIQYKNIDTLYFKIVKTSPQEKKSKDRLRHNDMVKFYLKQKEIKKWQVPLPKDEDFQPHSVEIKMDPLDFGFYIVLAGTSPDFDFKSNAVAYSFLSVSDIAYINRQGTNKSLEFQVMHRVSGHPLKDVTMQTWKRIYDKSQRRYILVKGSIFQTGSDGYVKVSWKDIGNNSFYVEFLQGKDRLFPDRNFNLYNKYSPYQKRTLTSFFTDRSIYRPGQTVFFKGIMMQLGGKAGEENKILPNQSTQVTLYDVNHQKVNMLSLKTNDFGTFSGSFQLPVGRLGGRMRISNSSGTTHISMEEYKRPKFKVTFNPLENSYRLNDNVTVNGLAHAYAGYNIDGAEVAYRVVRRAFYPYPWYYRYWYGGYVPDNPQMEILNGVTKTDANGLFKISFDAVPDLSLSKKLRPAFTFTVYADVTDLNGETRSSSKPVYIGYTALKLNARLPDKLDKDQTQLKVAINSSNLGGDFVAAKGNITIYKLKSPQRIFRKRMWTQPDKYILSKNEYYAHFPRDIYADEDRVHTWQKEHQVFSTDFDTDQSKEFTLNALKRWQPGKYMLSMNAKDRYGNPVDHIRYFTLYTSGGRTLPFRTPDFFTLHKGTAEPGQQAVILTGSAERNVKALYEIEYRGQIIQKKFLTLNKKQQRILIPILEKHRGNISVHITFVSHNRLYKHTQTIIVPWSNKKLDLSFATFRNKLLPGQKERWRIKIKGPKGDQVAAEMVAALYDASLDAFRPHNWIFNIFPSNYSDIQWVSNPFFSVTGSRLIGRLQTHSGFSRKYYDRLNWFGFYWRAYHRLRYKRRPMMAEAAPAPASAPMEKRITTPIGRTAGARQDAAKISEEITVADSASMVGMAAGKKKNGDKREQDQAQAPKGDHGAVKARTNFNETAFFYPHLKTSPEGDVIIEFTVPEALTKWKMMGLAHTKQLQYGFLFNELVTQKELMVVPNAPRFFREGDEMVFTSKVTNLSDKALSGTARLQLLDAVTMQPVNQKFKKESGDKPFIVKKGQSGLVKWRIKVPDDLDAVTYRLTATAGSFSDGEEKAIPILTNRMLVTESMPLPVRSLQTKSFQFKKLINSGKSNTLKHHKVTLEFTSNPVWYAVQALPYLMEYPHECMEQVFSRYYANSLASYIVHADPKIKRVFDLWKNAAKDSPNANALLSNLEKNQELKSVLLEETPWVMNGQNETQRKKRIALLFDLNSMALQLDRTLKKLKEGQRPSGAWSWFKGMTDSRYITQHIVTGFAHLGVLKAVDIHNNAEIWKMMREAVPYLDRQITKDYQWLIKHDRDLNKLHLGNIQIHYLYARSYFQDIPMHSSDRKAFEYYKGQVKKYWTQFHRNKYIQGMMSLILNRYGDHEAAVAIAKSIKEHAIFSEEMGMYWKISYGYYWYQAPIETHALLIEVFDEVMKDEKSVDQLKTWLLKQKQTQDWRTTKATVEAVYALLLKGDQWLKESKAPEITIGKSNPITIIPGNAVKGANKTSTLQAEAGTGYFKTSWNAKEVQPDIGYVTVKNNNKIVAWGSLYWQYFEQLDKITPAKTPLHIDKKLFVEKPSPTGPVLHPIRKGTPLKVGDRIKVRIELRVDRNMEYVHMKDMRAATMEPEQVISRYRWQDGLGYYQTTKDASTNFFFDYLSKGTYVFEYPLRVTHEGDFSNGITSIQCMYAPEFTSHSEGVRVKID
jgi:uncharacterized protein YfaS (alpha-2-macroglobulin family)/aromatic ring-cleaving dioxygenase